jgi:hypothetical protein
MKARSLSAAALAAVLGAAASALAYPDGKFDAATPASGGCSCHSSAVANPMPAVNVLVLLDDTPIQQFAGYTPGKQYALSVWVLGPKVAFGGFNLKTSAGTLASVDTTSQTRMLTECGVLQPNTIPTCQPGVAGRDCGVRVDADCPVYDPLSADCHTCSTVDGTTCRACDATTIVDVQATHTFPPPPLPVDAKPVPNWDLTWTAPSPGVGDVSFWAAGNSVVPDHNTGDDMWNFLNGTSPIVIHQAGS